MMSEACRPGLPRSPQCDGGPESRDDHLDGDAGRRRFQRRGPLDVGFEFHARQTLRPSARLGGQNWLDVREASTAYRCFGRDPLQIGIAPRRARRRPRRACTRARQVRKALPLNWRGREESCENNQDRESQERGRCIVDLHFRAS